jgi:DNA-binding transcriptional ArsR family regulator
MKSADALIGIKENGLKAQEMLQGLFRANVFEVLEIIQSGHTMNVQSIEAQMEDIGQSQVSFALRDLRRAGIVQRQRIDKFKYYSVIPGSIGKINRICWELAEGYDASVTVMDQIELV